MVNLGCILKAEQEEREEPGRGDLKIRGRKQKTLSPWIITEPHPGARQGQRKPEGERDREGHLSA